MGIKIYNAKRINTNWQTTKNRKNKYINEIKNRLGKIMKNDFDTNKILNIFNLPLYSFFNVSYVKNDIPAYGTTPITVAP